MFSARLFLGLEVTPAVEELFRSADPQMVEAFVKNDDVYLSDLTYRGSRYLGKFAGEQTDITSLELLESNINSLLAILFPSENLSNYSLVLLSFIDSEHYDRQSME